MLEAILPAALLTAGIFLPLYLSAKGILTGKRRKYALIVNVASFAALALYGTGYPLAMTAGAAEAADAAAQAASSSADSMKYIAAAVAAAVSNVGAGIAVAPAVSSAIGAISENEKLFGKALAIVAIAEGIALYGIIVAFLILFV